MKIQLPLVSLFFILSSSLTAQSCTLSSNADFCTSCSGLINQATGVINGVITVPNNSGGENIPATCDFGSGPVPLIIGSVTLDVGTNSTLVLADDIGIQQGVTAITITGNGNADLEAAGTVFGRSDASDPSFLDLENAIAACAITPGCSTIGGAVTVLPVSLVDWSAQTEKSDILLSWSSSAEVDNDFYLLEHGTDGANFTEIARIDGQATGRSGSTRFYSFKHLQPGAGLHYYRLSQQDFDGTRSQLGLRSIVMHAPASVVAYPNPVAAGATVRLVKPQEERATVARLYSLLGREVASFVVAPQAATTEVDLPADLPAGVYLLRLAGTTTRLWVR